MTSDAAAAANKSGSAQCTGLAQSQAVWIMNLSVAGNTLAIPVYVNPTAGPEQTLGGYKLTICLPPPDVPVGTPGRAFQGAQLLDAKLTLNNVFTTPTGGGLIKWETLFTPYNPGIGTVNRAGTSRRVRSCRCRSSSAFRSSTRTRRPARTSCPARSRKAARPSRVSRSPSSAA